MRMLLIILGFFCSNTLIAAVKENDSYQKVMHIIHKYSDHLEKESRIELCAYGLLYTGPDKIYDGKIHEIVLGYSIDKRIQYEEGRKMFYRVADGLLSKLNADEKNKEYFYHFPVGYQDLKFSLSFDYKSKGILKKDDLYMIDIYQNKICYSFVNKDGQSSSLKLNEIVPDVFTVEMESKNRRIVRKLPEDPEAAKLAM